MAAIRVYGHKGCPLTAETVEWLESCGAAVLSVDKDEQSPSPAVQARIASFAGPPAPCSAAESALLADGASAGGDTAGKGHDAPYVVRGDRVVLATDPASLSSLIY